MTTKITSVSPASLEKSESNQPLFASQTAAGFGVPGDDSVDESLNVNDFLVRNPTSTFFVRVAGDSMEGAKIFDGDVLVVDRSVNPKDRALVVAAVNGDLVVKRLSLKGGAPQLLSENDSYQPIELSDADDCFIWGVVTGSARKLT